MTFASHQNGESVGKMQARLLFWSRFYRAHYGIIFSLGLFRSHVSLVTVPGKQLAATDFYTIDNGPSGHRDPRVHGPWDDSCFMGPRFIA